MKSIPTRLNGVTIEFDPRVRRDVDPDMIAGLCVCIKTDLAAGYILSRIWISSARDSHVPPSRHVSGKAVDISRINGVKLLLGYGNDPAITAIVAAIQEAFEAYPARRENFGPHLRLKHGSPWPVGGHRDHIHLSVD